MAHLSQTKWHDKPPIFTFYFKAKLISNQMWCYTAIYRDLLVMIVVYKHEFHRQTGKDPFPHRPFEKCISWTICSIFWWQSTIGFHVTNIKVYECFSDKSTNISACNGWWVTCIKLASICWHKVRQYTKFLWLICMAPDFLHVKCMP